MATDDSGNGAGDKPGSDTNKKAGEQDIPFEFVDRDDDLSDGRVDADYEERFPPSDPASGSGRGGEAPDPGYAAFAEDLDDPLADWPSPDARLEDLPEVQLGKAAAEAPQAEEPAQTPVIDFTSDGDASGFGPEEGVFTDDDGPSSTDDSTVDDAEAHTDSPGQDEEFPEAEFFDDPVEDDITESDLADDGLPAAFISETAEEDEQAPAFGAREPDAVDRDEEPQAQETGAPPEADPGPYDREPETLEHIPEPEPMNSLDFEEDEEDALVDDFLNDLDDIDEFEEEQALDRPPAEETVAAAYEPDGATAAASIAATAAVMQANDTSPAASRTAASSTTPEDQKPTRRGGDEARGLPWGMIVVVAIALVLLAAGGYGVVMQRSSLEAEIRELQAQLATALPPEEAAAERERQRQIELENESLAAELEGLQAENAALGEQIAALEAQVAERRAAEAEAREREQAAIAAREAEEAARKAAAAKAAAPAPAPASKPAGDWFVNFGSYAQRNVAERWAGKLAVDEGKIVVQQATAAGKSLYRVRVIGLPSQDRAERVATALERQHQLPRLWVGKD